MTEPLPDPPLVGAWAGALRPLPVVPNVPLADVSPAADPDDDGVADAAVVDPGSVAAAT